MTDKRAEYFWEGAKLSIANARDLFDSAAECAGRSRFGIASSLAILCTEECAKAYGLLARAVSGSDESRRLKKYFTSHETKHEMSRMILTLFRIFARLRSITFDVVLDQSISVEEKGTHLVDRVSEWSKAELEDTENIAGDISLWKVDADRTKQNGFYVDRVGSGWHSPAHIDEGEYLSRRNYAQEFLEILEAIMAYGSLSELRQLFDRIMSGTQNS